MNKLILTLALVTFGPMAGAKAACPAADIPTVCFESDTPNGGDFCAFPDGSVIRQEGYVEGRGYVHEVRPEDVCSYYTALATGRNRISARTKDPETFLKRFRR